MSEFTETLLAPGRVARRSGVGKNKTWVATIAVKPSYQPTNPLGSTELNPNSIQTEHKSSKN